MLWLIVIILVVMALVGAPGIGPWNHGYGYYPSGSIGLVVLILIILLLLGKI